MNGTSNQSSIYLDQDVCDEEKLATPSYIAVLGVFQAIALYFLMSLVLSQKYRSAASLDVKYVSKWTSILRSLLTAVILTINARLLLDLLQLGLGNKAHGYFGAIFLSKSILSTLNSSCVYAFMWLRQWIVYDQPQLNETKTKCFKIFNIFVLFPVISIIAAGPVVETRYIQLHLAEDGCMLVRTHKWTFALAIYTAFSIFYQLILLGFFIYPLLRARAHVGTENIPTVFPIVKRSALSAMACFADEIVFIVLHNVVVRPLMLNTVTTDLKLILYYVCMVASYNDWRRKFCFVCTLKATKIGYKTRAPSEFKSKLSSDDLEGKDLRSDERKECSSG